MRGGGGSDLDGVWEMVWAEFDGMAAPELVVQNTTITLAGDKYHVQFGGETTDSGTCEFGEYPETGTMRLRGITGPNSGRTIPAIFQFTGNRLRVCYGLDGVTPTEFCTQGTKARYLAAYRRVANPS
jgi:uncharacterized protein (TIGR03067 family)